MKNKHVYGRDTYREIKSFLIGHLVHEKHTTQSIMPNLKGWEQKQLFEIHLANQQKYCKGKKKLFSVLFAIKYHHHNKNYKMFLAIWCIDCKTCGKLKQIFEVW